MLDGTFIPIYMLKYLQKHASEFNSFEIEHIYRYAMRSFKFMLMWDLIANDKFRHDRVSKIDSPDLQLYKQEGILDDTLDWLLSYEQFFHANKDFNRLCDFKDKVEHGSVTYNYYATIMNDINKEYINERKTVDAYFSKL